MALMKGPRPEPRDPVDRVLEHPRHGGVVLRGSDYERIRLLEAAPELVGACGETGSVLLITVVRADGKLSHRGEFGLRGHWLRSSWPPTSRASCSANPRAARPTARGRGRHLCRPAHDDTRRPHGRRSRPVRERLTTTLGNHHSPGSRQTSGLASGGGGNRTRVRGRTGQSVYERSLRFDLTRTAGSQATYRRASHPLASPLLRSAFLRDQPVI